MRTLRLAPALLIALPTLATFATRTAAGATRTAAGQDVLPTPRQVVSRHLAATGLSERPAAKKSRRAVGKISIPERQLEGAFETVAARPDRYVQRTNIPGLGASSTGYDGDVGWQMQAMAGANVLEGEALRQLQHRALFDVEAHPAELYESMEVLGKVSFADRECLRLRLVRKAAGTESTAEGRALREIDEFYDVATGLKVGSRSTFAGPTGPREVTVVYDAYREFGGVRVPTRITQEMGGMQVVQEVETVEWNTVDEGAFEPPPEVRAILKKRAGSGDV